MRLLLAGTPEVAVASLDQIAQSRHDLVGVITRPDAPAGRGRRLRPSPVAERARELGLEVLAPRKPSDPEFTERLRALAPDCVPVVAYGELVPQGVIDIPRHGWVNLHFSLLPRWRGAAPVQRAILAGDTATGACTFSLVRELDAGPVYRELRTRIGAEESAGDLLDRLAASGAELLVETLDEIAAGAHPRPQDANGITHAAKITSADAYVDWQADDNTVSRTVRACAPAPGAWTTFRGDRFKIIGARTAPGERLAAGSVAMQQGRLLVGTGTRPLELLTVQPSGKRVMPGMDWARGAALGPSDRFGDG